MQKLINVLALTSFAVSAAVVGSGVYVYANKDALIDQVKEEAMGMVGGALGATLFSGPADDTLPDLPDPSILDETGAVSIPAIPFGM